MFRKGKDGQLEFMGMEKDENYADLENLDTYPDVYHNFGKGDSGGPVLRKIYRENGEERHVVVAVASSGNGISNIGQFLNW